MRRLLRRVLTFFGALSLMGFLPALPFLPDAEAVLFWVVIVIGAVSFVLVSSVLPHIIIVSRINAGNAPEKYDVAHHHVVDVPLPFDQTFERCKQALEKDNATIKSENIQVGHIVARAQKRVMLAKPVDHVEFRLHPVDAGHTSVEVISKPDALGTIYDNGRNLRRILQITRVLLADHGAAEKSPLKIGGETV